MSGIALVTGAGSGMGRAVAIALAGEGYRLALAGQRRAPLEETAQACPGALVAPTDVSDPAQVAGLFEAVAARFGRLDLLFNNAGMGVTPMPIEDLSFADWQQALGANLTGAFLCTQQAIKLMKAQGGGRIINNGSIAAHTPRPGLAAYAIAKHAITGLTKSVALEGRAFDIACGQIDIGNAQSQMTQTMQAGIPQPGGEILREPVMDVQDVARAVVYMASLPLGANVLFMTVMASKMPFVGRG